ncbi:cytochrome P450 [Streptomyces paromomycinus]|uniref:Cytochrome P450 n=1 Tax=Streptomyces paromomycinus TaxID=92743 RepID=A0A401VXY0_STREY|nr:cytochrome P450 [Streptomyces paromomycinus]
MKGAEIQLATDKIALHGKTTRAGEAVAAANHENRVFPNDVELNLHRIQNPHLAFGHGTYNHLGSHLAHATLQIGLEASLNRMLPAAARQPRRRFPGGDGTRRERHPAP